MVDKIIKVPKWQFETINNALRLTHRINNCHTKETAFDREVVKAYEYSKSALAETSSVPQANELLPHVSNSVICECGNEMYKVIPNPYCCDKCGKRK